MSYRLSTADREAIRRRELAAIHAMAAQLGMDTADRSPGSEYRMLLQQLGGKPSAADLAPEARRKVIRHLSALVAKPARSMSPRQFIELLWKQLGDAGKLDEPGPGGLSKFLHGQHGVHLPSALTGAQAARTIEALKAWKARGGSGR